MEIKSGVNKVTFKAQAFNVNISGLLFTPEGFDSSQKYPTILFNEPGLAVKEMMGSAYGKQMARRGYVYLCWDRMGFGDSEGPKHKLKVDQAIEQTRDAISYLRTLPFVDRDRLYGAGTCGGSISMVTTAFTDKRIKAVATISAVLGAEGWVYGGMDREAVIELYKSANEARQKEYETGEVVLYDNMPERDEPFPDGTPVEVSDGYEYYKTNRCGLGTNYSSLLNLSNNEDVFLGGFVRYADIFYTPYLGIVGKNSAYYANTDDFYQNCSEPKELFVVEGAGHVDLYDKEEFITQAADKMDVFFKKY
ncbi:alpha/beta hydrolase [Fulvivirgaceae bacterium BMA12]|uniref:Alpha/beta hydrolase n=1 Tax=Agaribacillus aureus TaxID=3051825 RepID=A0ABT8L0C8_9BACT|nr:alpha/beta hydrolase [Fulvivirgaceae bacterium BMA12]